MDQASVSPILKAAEERVERHYEEKVDELKYVYHNFQHTLDVVEVTQTIAQGYELSERDMEVLQLAAWFHDTGYDEGAEGHEQRGQHYARAFLTAQSYSEGDIQTVERLIEATHFDYTAPKDLLEEIIKDADYSHLGSNQYWDRCSRVRQEMLMTQQTFMSEAEWLRFELDFIQHHQFYTEYARELFEDRKIKNIKQLRKQLLRIMPELKKPKKNKPSANKDAELKELNLGRGVETMFRATYRTHVNLSSIADNKANIMLSINAIIISIVVSNLVPKFSTNPYLVIPTFVLLSVCLTTLVFAILSTRPKVTEGKFTRTDIESKRSNLLFFGNFYKMDINDFHWGMMEMIKDSDFLYSSMTRDLYYLGVVLAKKYRYLRICYNIFMYGLILAVILFAVSYQSYHAK